MDRNLPKTSTYEESQFITTSASSIQFTTLQTTIRRSTSKSIYNSPSKSKSLNEPSTNTPIGHAATSESTLHSSPTHTISSTSSTSSTASVASAVDSSPTFSDGAKKAVIAVTTIGGTLVLILLIFAIWRRRKADIVIQRTWQHADDGHLTALPSRQTHHSRSSKLGFKLSPQQRDMSTTFNKRFRRRMELDCTMPNRPPTRTTSKETQALLPSEPTKPPTLRPPDMTWLSITPSSHSSPSVQQAAFTQAEAGSPLISPNLQMAQDRWSWTNSQAPATPRMYAPSLPPSTLSASRFRAMKPWIRTRSERRTDLIDLDAPIPSRTKALKVPPLKNKASLPKLAPRPSRKLSKRNRVGNGSTRRTHEKENAPLEGFQ